MSEIRPAGPDHARVIEHSREAINVVTEILTKARPHPFVAVVVLLLVAATVHIAAMFWRSDKDKRMMQKILENQRRDHEGDDE